MKKFFFLCMVVSNLCYGQTFTLTLDSCLQMARRNYPLIKKDKLIAEMERIELSANHKNWLPKLSFLSKATYQSEVVAFPGISFHQDNYLAALDMEQTLYDAGQNRQEKSIDQLNSKADAEENEIELYKVIDQVTQLYANVLLARENIKILNVYQEDLKSKISNLEVAVKNGVSMQSSLDELEAEKLSSGQLIEETTDNLYACYQTLGMYINLDINDSTLLLTKPVLSASTGPEINRPELKLFETQKLLVETKNKLSKRNFLPRISISAEGAYGRPGPNFLNQDLRLFGQAAVNLKWNLNGFYTWKDNKHLYLVKQKIIDVHKEVFEFNTKSKLLTEAAKITALKNNLESDRLIIQKRKNVSKTASDQLDQGSITTSEYLSQLNAEMQAELNQKIHEIKLMNAVTNYNLIKGIINY